MVEYVFAAFIVGIAAVNLGTVWVIYLVGKRWRAHGQDRL
jgi:hypothetical protein